MQKKKKSGKDVDSDYIHMLLVLVDDSGLLLL